jgi:hypothetical protein
MMKKFLFVVGRVCAVALAVVVGTRISPDAMAVIIGIICGILASGPTSIVLVWVLRQRDRQLEAQAQMGPGRFGQYPPVVVVNGQGTNGYGNGYMPQALPSTAAPMGSRDFKVIGQENTETVGDILPSFWE